MPLVLFTGRGTSTLPQRSPREIEFAMREEFGGLMVPLITTRAAPWTQQTPSLATEFVAFRDEQLDPPALVVQVGKTGLRYHLSCIDDLRAMLKAHGDWMPLGNADVDHQAFHGRWPRASGALR